MTGTIGLILIIHNTLTSEQGRVLGLNIHNTLTSKQIRLLGLNIHNILTN